MIGFLKTGSLESGFLVRLSGRINTETLRIGDFVVIEGNLYNYFGIIDDLVIASSSEDVFFDPPSTPLQREVVKGTFVYSEALVSPYLMVEKGTGNVMSVKTVPEHFSQVRKANEDDLALIFGKSDQIMTFEVGTPLTMSEPIYIKLDRLSKRNNAIFGITGSGKTFLARIVFSGIIKYNVASLLIFDMHNEYGRFAKSENGKINGLRALFPSKVKVFDVSKKNKDADDYITIPYKDITAEDVSMLSSLLNFSEKSAETAFIIQRKKGSNWLSYLFSLAGIGEKELAEKAETLGVNVSALDALIRHLLKLKNLGFVRDTDEESSIDKILNYLKQGISVVIQFSGKSASSMLAYFTVANVISRRIHDKFVDMNEAEREKSRVMIVIEEAHKFLSTELKEKNIFGIIAREMRKFNVTLFVIDQRPSEIDPEVLSQVGTRFVLQLMDEKDMNAVFQGVGGGNKLKKILRTLQPREVLLFGYAVPMPIAMRVREYGKEFFEEFKESKKFSPEDAENNLY